MRLSLFRVQLKVSPAGQAGASEASGTRTIKPDGKTLAFDEFRRMRPRTLRIDPSRICIRSLERESRCRCDCAQVDCEGRTLSLLSASPKAPVATFYRVRLRRACD